MTNPIDGEISRLTALLKQAVKKKYPTVYGPEGSYQPTVQIWVTHHMDPAKIEKDCIITEIAEARIQ